MVSDSPPSSSLCLAGEHISLAESLIGESAPQAGEACWCFSFHQLCKSLSLFGLNVSESGLEIYLRLLLVCLARGSAALWKHSLRASLHVLPPEGGHKLLKIHLGLGWKLMGT